MKSALKAMGKSPKAKPKSLKEIEEDFESNTGFDPEDPPPSLDASSMDTVIPIEVGQRLALASCCSRPSFV